MIWEFMTGSVLEHVSQNVPYLIGRPLGRMPVNVRREWQELLHVLQSSCHIIARDPHMRIREGEQETPHGLRRHSGTRIV